MDSNKDEANRCIEIGLTAMRLGNLDKASKMFDKAQRLFPSKRAEDLLKDIQNNRKHSQEHPSTEDTQSQPRRRRAADTSSSSAAGSASAEPTYTPDQVTLVKKVLKCKDFYEVLSVCKESTDAEIKKAYKKLALKLHPDKNTAPGAVEAFKKVGSAVSILTDAEKRKRYDLYGPEEAVAQRSGRSSRQSNMYSDYYDYDSYYSAEDVFNMYFSGFQNPHAHNGRRGFRRQYDTEYQREGAGDHQQMTFGLILMIIVVLSMTSFFRSDPVYSLSPSNEYSVTRQTTSLHVPYYVKSNFDTEYQGPLSRLELAVEEQYVAHMKQQCYRERHYREMMMARARSFGNKAQFAQAQEMKTPSCDNLYRIGKYQY